MKLSQIYGMSVRAQDGTASGYVIKIYTDGEKISGLLCADEHENEFYIPFESARPTKNNAENYIIYTFSQKSKPAAVPLALGRACYNGFGEYMGVLMDINCRGLKLVSARIGAKNYAVENVVFGDAVIVKPSAAALKSDVRKDGKVIFRRGEETDEKLIARAISLGEYVQTNLKKI